MFLRARAVLPITRPPIHDGAVLITGNRIARVGRWKDLAAVCSEKPIDLGDVILMPGLVNAHCHLDYTDMAGRFPPQKSFVDWIKLITTAKSEWNYSEFAESWLNGAHMLVRTGTTTVADFEAVPELLPEVWHATPLRVISFLELTGVKSRRQPEAMLHEALAQIDSLPAGRSAARLAPHAPYSTQPELLSRCAKIARDRQWPLSVHVSESATEFEMFVRATGEMHGWLQRNERDMSDCGLGSPLAQLHRQGALEKNLVAVHVNYLAEKDAALLRRKKTNVAHCPRSHFYFRHRKFPLRELRRAGVNLCLGTDSLATVYKKPGQVVELDLFAEMRALDAAHPTLGAKNILQMATVNGARALGLAGQAGEISPGALADLIAIPFSGKRTATYAAALAHQGRVAASLIDGQWAVPPAFC